MPANAHKARSIFLDAVESCTPEQWPSYLDQACAGDPLLRQRVEVLLRAHGQPNRLLDCPGPKLATGEAAPREQSGLVIGPYKLLEEIGEGGFGVVWMAEQTRPVQRKVALKLIKPGMDTRQVVARFEVERQALALMDHPHIARVLDAGTSEDGRPYFVMELVRGIPITQFCDEHGLALRQRLELFVSVCRAVQHAHTKGIIHRDLKPSNVMVTLHDGTPVVKVIDFGIAKALGQQLTDRTLFTGYTQLLGTPLYMSPEQAALSGLDVDTRSDIYSLGVLLYELLTGTTPFNSERLRAAGYDEMRRIIREEEPATPSQRISQTRSAERGMRNAGAVPRSAFRVPRWQELDWIVMKALEKDRSRRYETASALAADVLRHLHDEPVQACPPTVAYRLRKFVRRNRGLVLAASLVLLALGAGIVGTTWGMIRAEHAREEAQKRLAQIEKGTEILASVFRDLDPLAGENDGASLRVVLGRRLAEAAKHLEGEAVGDPLIVARLQHELGVSLFELGHREQAEELLVKADRTRQELLGADHLDTAATRHHLAALYRDQAQYARAQAMLEEVLAARTARLGADNPATLASHHLLAWLYQSQGKLNLAETLFTQVLALRTARLGADHVDALTSRHRLANIYLSRGKFAEAEAMLTEVLAVRTAKLGPDHLDTAATKGSLALLYHNQEKYGPAELLYKEALATRAVKVGPYHPDTLGNKRGLATLYQAQGKYALAETLFEDVVASCTAKLGADDPATLNTRLRLAELCQAQGKYDLAETILKEVQATSGTKLGPDHQLTLASRDSLAMLYWSRKKLNQSIPLFEGTFRLRKAKLEPDHPDTINSQFLLASNYFDAHRFADAIPLFEELHRKGLEYPRGVWVSNSLLDAYLEMGKTTEAIALVTEIVQVARKKWGADSSDLAVIMGDRARRLVEGKLYAAAEPLLRASLTIREKLAADAWATHHTRALLGAALLGQQKYAEAEQFLVQGYEGLKERTAMIPPEEQGILAAAVERLVQLYDAWGKPGEAARWRKELAKRKE